MSSPPWFEDLTVGTVFTAAPAVTLTEGSAALHQAIAGDRLRLALDRTLAEAVAGAPVAHPALVWDVAIGQSTVATGRVVANLFYRGLLLRRPVRLGDTLRTTTDVVARRENRPKEGRRPTGLAVLHIRTVDQEDRPVLDFTRCAMLPLRGEPTGEPGDEVGGAADLDAEPLRAAAEGLDLAAYRAAVPGPHFDDVPDGWAEEIEGGDVVDSAPALARLTTNVAMAHLDATSTADGRRLVYGGHAIGLAAGQATRALPGARDDPRLARLRPHRAGVRGRHAALADRARAPRAAAGRRRAAAPALACEQRGGGRARLALRGGAGMTAQPLADLRVIEGSAFVAAPLGGMTLAQLGADVIRFDQIGGGIDFNRWPLAPSGRSLFWAGLNKGKRSIQVDLRSPEGRELVGALVGAGAGSC